MPEAEPLVGDFRRQFDVSAQAGLGAHVTILFPFLAPQRLTSAVSATLTSLFAQQPAFTFALSRVERFPSVLYLAPDPPSCFARLTQAVATAFPECPAYGGAFAEPIPHLTVAQAPPVNDLSAVKARFCELAAPALPISCSVRDVALAVKRDGRWSTLARFALRSSDDP